MSERPLVVYSNLPRLGAYPQEGQDVEHHVLTEPLSKGAAWGLLRNKKIDALVIDGSPRLLHTLCWMRWLRPRWLFGGPNLFSIDLVLNQPHGFRQRLAAFFKRQLLRSVAHFLHYFQDLGAYGRWFGVTPARSTFVPFKVNGWKDLKDEHNPTAEGDYVFTSGVSMRDYPTFMQAMGQVKAPGLLVYIQAELCQENGTPFPPPFVPDNVKLQEDDGQLQSWINAIRQARVVVVPVLPGAIRAVGISLALVAMGLGKCVIITEGATTRGVFGDEVVTVPPGNAPALAQAIVRAWNDAEFRQRHGQAARRYAEQVGGEERLYPKVLDVVRRVCRKETMKNGEPRIGI